jgi:hypothetical protein
MPSSLWWCNFDSICRLTRATRWAPFYAETEFFVYFAQWLRQSQDDTGLCSSSLLVNLQYSYPFITLEIAECNIMTRLSLVALHLYSTRIHSEPKTVLESVKHLLSTCFLSWCGVCVFPPCLNHELWVHGPPLARNISSFVRPGSRQEDDHFQTLLARNVWH